MKDYAIYLRVSTRKQGESGLGLEAQRKICTDFVNANGGQVVREFIDVESGTHRDRKGLSDAVSFAKQNNVPLVIAKLDRLARDVGFCFKVVNTGIEIHFVDMPTINTLLLGVFAAVAQYERELTSDRTKKALAAKKARGEKIGAASDKWRQSYSAKSRDERRKDVQSRADAKRANYLASHEVQAFLRILRSVFPEAATGDDYTQWTWRDINTRGDSKQRILSLMQDYRHIEPTLFSAWDFSANTFKLQVKLSNFISSIKRSING